MDQGREFFFLKKKPGLALLAVRELDPAYASKVSKEIDSTFSHTLKILAQMEDMGLVRSWPEGRVRRLELTEKGENVASAVSDLIEAFRWPSQEWERIGRLKALVEEATELPASQAVLKMGPLRRDLSLLKEGDEKLRQAAEDLDRRILAIISE